jgi:hypothetical protein
MEMHDGSQSRSDLLKVFNKYIKNKDIESSCTDLGMSIISALDSIRNPSGHILPEVRVTFVIEIKLLLKQI